MFKLLAWIPFVLFLLFSKNIEKSRHKRKIIKSELNKQAAFFLRSRLHMDPLYKQDIPNQVLKLKNIESRIERINSWSERRIYRNHLKKYQEELSKILKEVEEEKIRSKVKSEFTKLTEVEESLDRRVIKLEEEEL